MTEKEIKDFINKKPDRVTPIEERYPAVTGLFAKFKIDEIYRDGSVYRTKASLREISYADLWHNSKLTLAVKEPFIAYNWVENSDVLELFWIEDLIGDIFDEV